MWNMLESFWPLLTLAGIAFVIAAVVRQEKPEWGIKPLLIPLLLAILAFGLDYAVVTDYEAVSAIVPACKRACVNDAPETILSHISPNYRDRFHADRASIHRAIERGLQRASVEKIRTQSHVVTISQDTAQSSLTIAVHLNTDSQYAAAGSLVFVEMEFDYEKIEKQWLIKSMEVKSVNQHPMNWGDIPM